MTIKPGTFTVSCLLLLTLAAYGCGDNADASPEDKCNMIVSAHCARVAECGASLFRSKDEEQRYVDLCEADFSSGFCNKATGVATSFDQCLHALPHATCELRVTNGGFTPSLDIPVSCLDVVNYTK